MDASVFVRLPPPVAASSSLQCAVHRVESSSCGRVPLDHLPSAFRRALNSLDESDAFSTSLFVRILHCSWLLVAATWTTRSQGDSSAAAPLTRDSSASVLLSGCPHWTCSVLFRCCQRVSCPVHAPPATHQSVSQSVRRSLLHPVIHPLVRLAVCRPSIHPSIHFSAARSQRVPPSPLLSAATAPSSTDRRSATRRENLQVRFVSRIQSC
jgi:hypothetical protein